MIKLEQRGYTIVELLVSIGILGILTPLLALALFQILTFTERGRAGFEAQADTRNASAWMSQDIVMAQESDQVVIDPFASSTLLLIEDPICGTSAVAFTWTDLFEDRDADHEVTYCLFDSAAPPADTSPFPECPAPSKCLVRSYDGVSNVVGRYIESVSFARAADEKVVTVTIKSAPENRFGVSDEKTFRVLMRPTA